MPFQSGAVGPGRCEKVGASSPSATVAIVGRPSPAYHHNMGGSRAAYGATIFLSRDVSRGHDPWVPT